MRWVKTVLREVFGLFVDDGSFAVAILLWLALAWLLLSHLAIPGGIKGPILFVGLAAILAGSAVLRGGR